MTDKGLAPRPRVLRYFGAKTTCCAAASSPGAAAAALRPHLQDGPVQPQQHLARLLAHAGQVVRQRAAEEQVAEASAAEPQGGALSPPSRRPPAPGPRPPAAPAPPSHLTGWTASSSGRALRQAPPRYSRHHWWARRSASRDWAEPRRRAGAAAGHGDRRRLSLPGRPPTAPPAAADVASAAIARAAPSLTPCARGAFGSARLLPAALGAASGRRRVSGRARVSPAPLGSVRPRVCAVPAGRGRPETGGAGPAWANRKRRERRGRARASRGRGGASRARARRPVRSRRGPGGPSAQGRGPREAAGPQRLAFAWAGAPHWGRRGTACGSPLREAESVWRWVGAVRERLGPAGPFHNPGDARHFEFLTAAETPRQAACTSGRRLSALPAPPPSCLPTLGAAALSLAHLRTWFGSHPKSCLPHFCCRPRPSGNQDGPAHLCLWQCLWAVVVLQPNNQNEVENW